jgi:hypothetical protein
MGNLGISLSKILRNLPNQTNGAVSGNQALNVFVIGLVEGTGDLAHQRGIFE